MTNIPIFLTFVAVRGDQAVSGALGFPIATFQGDLGELHRSQLERGFFLTSSLSVYLT